MWPACGVDCEDYKIRDMLSDYFTRHLTAAEMASVREHVEHCKSCREKLGLMELLNENNEAAAGSEARYHLPDDLLVEYYQHRDSMDRKTIERIEQHLADCRECSNGLAFLTGLEKGFLQSAEISDSEPGIFERLLSVVVNVVRRPTFAYVIVLILAYPAFQWMISSSTDPGEANFLPLDSYVIGEQTRSTEGLTQVFRNRPDAIVHLKIPFYPLDKRYEASIESEADKAVRDAEVILYRTEQGIINVLLTTRNLRDGVYIIDLHESDWDKPLDKNPSRYRFELLTR